MSGMALVYVIGLVLIGRNFNAALIRALELNEENKRLLANMEHEVQVRTTDLQKARAEAERANQAKSRFLAAASHDLRQPMQSLFLFANALHHYVADRKGVDALVRIERGLDILKGMLDSLLDVSRLDVNVIQPQITTFPLRPMLDDIVVSYRRIAASKDIELRRGTLSDCLVRSDKTLLGRMIRNLIENAIRYTERGHITLSSHLSGKTVRVEVQDTGIGIAPDQLERIFEEFHQVGNPERDKARGLGLGLAIVQRLSAVLGHSVEVRSQLGEGSTFSIEVPATEAVPAQSVSAANAAVPVGSGSGRQVVLIDDDPMVLLALGGVFEGWGYQVVMAGSQEEAFEQLRSSTTAPHLIVADYRLRNGKVGTDAIRDLHATCGTAVPSIILTGETGKECVRDAEALGSMILHKPVTPHQLSFVLKRLFGEAGAG
ncbi:MAG: response regulator [Rhodospirillales bacterium]|nr:response regulator [Rhodospirillales bacterium]